MFKIKTGNDRILIKWVVCFMTILVLNGCQTQPQSPEDARFNEIVDILRFATDPKSPDVVAGLNWMKEQQRFVSIGYLFQEGTHDDIIMEVVKLSGTEKRSHLTSAYSSSTGRYMGLKVTPYQIGNPFQLAVASARPELAKRIAIYHAKKNINFDPDIPLGAIPSIHRLASQPTTNTFHFHRRKNETAPKAVNENVPADAYVNPPGRGLMFRHAAAHEHSLGRVYGRDILGKGYDFRWRDLANSRTHSDGGRGKYADGYADFLEKRHAETVEFIYRNFGGNPNETLPYCILRHGKPWHVCADFTPTQLAGRTTNMNDFVLDDNDRMERNPGKLQAYLRIGGDPNLKDRYGNSAISFAQNGGKFPGDKKKGSSISFGQLMAGATVLAGSAYMANHGAYDKASQFLAGGMADVITGSTTNLSGMLQQQRRDTALAEANLQRHIQVLAEQTYITPETWNNTSASPKQDTTDNPLSPTPPASGLNPQNQSGTGQKALAQSVGGMGTFTFTCPESGKTHSVPMPPVEGACKAAAERMARTTSCNMIDEYPEAIEQYHKACASSMYQ